MTPLNQARFHFQQNYRDKSDSIPPRCSAILLHDDEKDLIEAIVFFEGGKTTIEHFFSASVFTTADHLAEAKEALSRHYQLHPENIHTYTTSLDPSNPRSPSAE